MTTQSRTSLNLRFLWLFLPVTELLAISLLYQHGLEFKCRAEAPAFLCSALSRSVVRALCVGGVLCLAVAARPDLRQRAVQGLFEVVSSHWLLVHIFGVALILAPWAILSVDINQATVFISFSLWLAGLGLAVYGGLQAFLSTDARSALRDVFTPTVLIACGIAAVTPEFADGFQYLWRYDPLTNATFAASHWLLQSLGETVESDADTFMLAVGNFGVLVGRQCSGIEGFALISGFLTFYAVMFQDTLRISRIWILLPIGLLVSWLLNVGRISVLMLIGAHVSPDLAIGGFHSHAGWLLFTILSLGLVGIAHQLPMFRKHSAHESRGPLPFWSDLPTAQIFPFIVFMAGGLLAQTALSTPDLAYPLRIAVVGGVLLLFLPVLRGIAWRLDPLSLGTGLAIGVLWLFLAPEPSETSLSLVEALQGLGPVLLGIWILARVIGTVVIVPMVEEMFFRGYLLGHLDRDSLAWRISALIGSSALFGVLHGRWWEASIAGFAYGLLYLRSRNIADAIFAHAASNLVIAVWAVAFGAWWVI